MDARLLLACKGKSYSQGGLNITHLQEMLKNIGLPTSGKRQDLLDRLCQPRSQDIPQPIHVPKPPVPKPQPKPPVPKPQPQPPKPIPHAPIPIASMGVTGYPAVPGTVGTECDGRTNDYRYSFDTGKVSSLDHYFSKDGYDHAIYEQGTSGDCMYCCYAASLNELNRSLGNPERYSMKQIRNIVADHIRMETDGLKLQLLYFQETENWSENIQVIKNNLVKLTRKTTGLDRRQGTDYDARLLSHIFNVGIIVFNLIDGTVVCTDHMARPYYTLILWDTSMRYKDENRPNGPLDVALLNIGDLNHYRVIGIRPKAHPIGDFKFVLPCNELPASVIENAKKCNPDLIPRC
jgi:hypothetical protein